MDRFPDFPRGDDVNVDVVVENRDGERVNITDSTIWFTMKKQSNDPDSSAVIQEKITAHSNPSKGESSIKLTDTQTDSLVPGRYHYDVQIVTSGGNILTPEIGQLRVYEDITRSTS